MSAYCAICSPKLKSPAYVACINCGQFACDEHHYVWKHQRNAFCEDCWFDISGSSMLDIADAIHNAREERNKQNAKLERARIDESVDSGEHKSVPRRLLWLLGVIDEDKRVRDILKGTEDPSGDLVILLRLMADLIEKTSR